MLFTDVVGSTALKQRMGDEAGVGLVQEHHGLVRQILGQFPEAEEISTAGDSFFLVFTKPSEAVRFALLLQSGLRKFNQDRAVELHDRVGLHLGEVLIEEGKRDVHGMQVDTCARVMSLAQAGQILMTRSVFDNARQSLKGKEIEKTSALTWLNHGRFELKGVEEPIEICEVRAAESGVLSPPTTSEKARRVEPAEGDTVLGWRPAVGQAVPNTQWVLEEKLGEGGFGEVWLGQHQTLRERHVFKFCFRADRIRSLKREVTLFRLLKDKVGEHAGIVRLHNVNFDQAPFFLEEEYVLGRDLRNWCDAQGGADKLSLEMKLELVAQAAEALQAAHDAGIIHRDVKPGNILVSGKVGRAVPSAPRPEPEGDGSLGTAGPALKVKLTDFGIGQVTSEEVLKDVTRAGFTQTMLGSTSTGTGTTMYLAPEIIAGNPATTRSDIYSLGVVLYQLLIGDFRKPLTADWARLVPDPLLREDLEKCFAGAPEERFTAAGLLAAQLRNYHQRQEAAWQQQRQQRAAALRRRAYAVLGIAIMALLIVAAALGYGLRQAREERDRAQAIAYRSDIYHASRELLQNRTGSAYNLLNQNRSDPKRREKPGWEWRYMWRQVQGDELYTLGTSDLESPGMRMTSRTHVARTLWCEDDTGRIELWDVESRQLLAVRPMERPCLGITVSPIDQTIAVASWGQTIFLFDSSSLQPKATVELSQGCKAVEISPDGRWLAAAQEYYLAVVDLNRRVQVCWTNSGAERQHGIAFSPDSQLIASPTKEGRVALWRVPNLALMKILGKPKGMGVAEDLAFSPDGRSVFFSASNTVDRLDIETGDVESKDFELPVTALSVSRDGTILACGKVDGHLYLCDAKTLEVKSYLQGHRAVPTAVLFSDQDNRLVSCAADGIKVWDPAKVSRSHAYDTKEVGHNSAISPNGRFVAWFKPRSQVATLTDVARWQDVAQFAFPTNATLQAISAEGGWVVGSDPTGCIYAIETATSRCVEHRSTRETDPPGQVRFGPSGRRFLTSANFVLSLWDAQVPRALTELETQVWRPAFINLSPGEHYAVAGAGRELQLWDLRKSSHQIVRTSFRKPAYGATFLPPNGSTLAVTAQGGDLGFWDLTRNPPVALPGRAGRVGLGAWDLACSSDGERLFAPHSGGLRVASAYSGLPLAQFPGLTGPRRPGFAVHPDGNTIVWMTAGQLVTWRAPSFAEIEAVEKAEADRQQAHKAAAELMVTRTREAGVVKQWLVLAPIPFPPGIQSGAAALNLEQIPQEARLHPQAGDRVKLAKGKRTWRAVQLNDAVIDFTRLSGKQTVSNVAYAVCYIRSDQDRTGLLLKVGSDDQAKIYLNGKEIYRQLEARACVPDQDKVEQGVELKAGLNVLVFKVVNELGDWQGAVRLTDKQGREVKGTQVTLKPE